ncbi:hypothetical protein NL676_021408 [Syzygium grande]|nr:hypothetical protein NL676_021408 [Syzygium grande]
MAVTPPHHRWGGGDGRQGRQCLGESYQPLPTKGKDLSGEGLSISGRGSSALVAALLDLGNGLRPSPKPRRGHL